MDQKSKSLFTKLLMIIMTFCLMLGVWFALPFGKDKAAKAEETLDVTDLITITQDDWMSGNPTDCTTFSIRINKADGSGYLYEYLVANSSIQGYWNDNGARFATTNGVDIMEYLYFNGESARSIVSKNQSGTTTFAGTTFPLSAGGQYSPIAIETSGSFAKMMILKEWMTDNSFTFTIKSGFKLLVNDGKTITTTNDVTFKYANGSIAKAQAYTLSFDVLDETMTVMGGDKIGALPEVPAKDGYTADGWKIDGIKINADTVYSYGANKTAEAAYIKNVEKVDATAKIGIENRSNWSPSENPDHLYFALTHTDGTNGWLNVPASDLVGYWNDHPERADANYGVDIMEYLYINDTSVRDLVMANKNGQTSYKGTTFPFSAGSWYAPVLVEPTTGSGLFFRVLNDYVKDLGGTFNVTIKAGFTITDEHENVLEVKKDIVYKYDGASLIKIVEATLSFDGLDDTIAVKTGDAIGELPAVPAKEGYKAIGWKIDGVAITADTVWTYTENKTAVAEYEKIIEKLDVTETITIDSAHGENQSQFKIALNPAENLTKDAIWNIYGADFTAANNGVDIMNYIYINGQNARTLSDNNRENNTYPVDTASGWLTNSDQCRPVFVETSTDGVYVTVLHAFSTANYTITLKAGFALMASDNECYTISEDVDFLYMEGKILRVREYVLSFDGLDETKTVIGELAIGELPEVPEKANSVVIGWMIDGALINADTVYSYGENKTAVALYKATYTLSFEGLEDTITVISGDAIGELPAIPEKANAVAVAWTIDGVEITTETLWAYNENKTAIAIYLNQYELSFEGWNGTIVVTEGQAIGELPAIPETANAVAVAWTIDGVEITAETLWTYTENKMAVATYLYKYELSFDGLEDVIVVTEGQAIGELPAVPERTGYTAIGWTVDGNAIDADTVYSYGENKTAVAVYGIIEYTITIVRANGTEETISFNVENAESKLAEVVLTEGNEEYAYEWKEALPTALEAQDYVFTEIEIDLLPDTRIISYSVSIGVDFAVNMYVEVVDDQIPQMCFTMGEESETVEGVLVNADAKKYVYRLENIAAYDLATEFTASLMLGDVEIDSMSYSVEAYLNELAQMEISDELKTLIADVIVYAQAAEETVSKEDGIQAIDGLVATSYTDLTETDYKKSTSDGLTQFTSVSVVYTDANRLAIRFIAQDTENLIVKINGNEVEFTEVEEGSGVYEIQGEKPYITSCDDRFKVTLSVDGEVAQTMIYSVKSYVYDQQNGEDAAYAKALYNLSQSLKAYEGV